MTHAGQPGSRFDGPQGGSSRHALLCRVPTVNTKPRSVFEVFVWATVATISAITFGALFFVWSVLPGAQEPLSLIRPGGVFTPPAAATERKPSVLIFARSTCSACRAEVPVYRTLVMAAHDSGSFSVFLLSPEERGPATAFGREIGLAERYVVSGRSSALDDRIRTVPTIVLLTAENVVQRVWQGRLSPSDRRALPTGLGLRADLLGLGMSE